MNSEKKAEGESNTMIVKCKWCKRTPKDIGYWKNRECCCKIGCLEEERMETARLRKLEELEGEK